MSSTLESGLKTYDWATDSTQSFVTGMNDNSAILDKSIKWNDQVKREFYKQMCKDVTSVDGSDVTVNNGLNGYVLSGEMKGNTVKNLSNLGDFVLSSADSKTMSNKGYLTNTKYTIMFNSDKDDANVFIQEEKISNVWISTILSGVKKGWNIVTYTSTSNSEVKGIKITGNANTLLPITINNFLILEGTYGYKPSNSYIPFGLTSTTAQITNNGINYPFYLTEADKTNKKPILLGGVGGVYDTLTVNEDGSGVLVQNTYEETFDGSVDESWEISMVSNTCPMFYNKCSDRPRYMSIPISDTMMVVNISINDTINTKGIHIPNSGEGIRLRTGDNSINSVALLKTWLNTNKFTVRYQLATPITTQITKELMPTILTQLSNQFKVGDAVKASSYSLKVPTSDGVKSETNLTLLNGYVAVANSLTPVCRLTKDNRVEITLDCTSPSTFNATVTSIPLNMRPLKDVRIIGFVDGVATPVTIKTTGEVQLPNSIVSKNVYIKDTYRLNAN